MVEYLKWHHRRLALDYEWLSENVADGSKVLEIGGFPFFLSSAISHNSISLEIVDKMSDIAFFVMEKNGITVEPCDIELEPLPYENDVFDEVIFNEVFEHLRIDPIFSLREVFRVLKPGGRIWLSTPNMGSLRGMVNLIFRNEAWSVVGGGVFEQYAHLEQYGWMGHVREYTSREVSEFLDNIGFKVIQLVYRGEYEKNPIAKFSSKIFPRFLPYFTCIAKKP